jgi:hypothetical protein
VNQIGIFGWPSNYITMGVTFEYLLDFWRPRYAATTETADSDNEAGIDQEDSGDSGNGVDSNGKGGERRRGREHA